MFLVLRRVWFLGPSYDWSRLAALTPVTAGPLNPSTILTSDILEGHYLPKLVFTGVPLLLLRYMMYLQVVLCFIQDFCVWEGGGVFFYQLSAPY